MGYTAILHDVKTPSYKKIAAIQPVDRYRKMLQRQQIAFTEEETTLPLVVPIDCAFRHGNMHRTVDDRDQKTATRKVTIFRF